MKSLWSAVGFDVPPDNLVIERLRRRTSARLRARPGRRRTVARAAVLSTVVALVGVASLLVVQRSGSEVSTVGGDLSASHQVLPGVRIEGVPDVVAPGDLIEIRVVNEGVDEVTYGLHLVITDLSGQEVYDIASGIGSLLPRFSRPSNEFAFQHIGLGAPPDGVGPLEIVEIPPLPQGEYILSRTIARALADGSYEEFRLAADLVIGEN